MWNLSNNIQRKGKTVKIFIFVYLCAIMFPNLSKGLPKRKLKQEPWVLYIFSTAIFSVTYLSESLLYVSLISFQTRGSSDFPDIFRVNSLHVCLFVKRLIF